MRNHLPNVVVAGRRDAAAITSLVAFTSCLLMLLAPARAHAYVQFSQSGHSAGTSAVKVDAADVTHVAWSATATGDLGAVYYTTIDKDGNRGPLSQLSASNATIWDIDIAVADDGQTYVAWTEGNVQPEMHARAIAPDGTVAAVIQDISPPGDSTWDVNVEVDSSDVAHMAWRSQVSGDYLTEYRTMTAAGTLGSIVDLSAPGQQAQEVELATEPATGESHVVWRRWNGANDVVQYASVAPNDTPGATIDISPGENAYQPQIAVDAAGVSSVAWTQMNANYVVQLVRVAADDTPSAPIDIETDPNNADVVGAFDTSATGQTTIAWGRVVSGHQMMRTVQVDAMGTAGAIHDMSAAGTSAGDLNAIATSNGTTFTAWRLGATLQLRAIQSDGTVQSMQEIVPAADGASFPLLAANGSDEAVAVWRMPIAGDGTQLRWARGWGMPTGTPTSLSFGSQEVGTGATAAKTVTVTNAGLYPIPSFTINIGGIAVVSLPHRAARITDAGDATSFHVASTTCASLDSTETCTVKVTFDPVSAGAKSSHLMVLSGAGGYQYVPLTGTGTSKKTTSDATACPSGTSKGVTCTKRKHGCGLVITGTSRADTIVGSRCADVINGGKGADTIRAKGGNDIVHGGLGKDGIDGGRGNDRIHGDIGPDRYLRGGPGADLIWWEPGGSPVRE